VPLLGKYFSAALFLLAVGLLILGLSRNDGPLARLLAWAPIFFLGEISYSIYLTHGVAQRVLKIVLPAEHFAASSLAVRAVILLLYVAALFALSLGIYYAVERPARKWLRRIKVVATAQT
jgi:peptidoglycan/LPS O-acetylase OafA/YrhL